MKTKIIEYIKIDRAAAVEISWREHSICVQGFDPDSGKGFDFELYSHDDKLFNGQGYAMERVAEELAKRYPDRMRDVAEKYFKIGELDESEDEKI
jgi:hypothetical protein